jgi:hypothetical protein
MQVGTFKRLHGEDQMAVDKLREGIEGFAKDQVKLEALIHEIVEGGSSLITQEHGIWGAGDCTWPHQCTCSGVNALGPIMKLALTSTAVSDKTPHILQVQSELLMPRQTHSGVQRVQLR